MFILSEFITFFFSSLRYLFILLNANFLIPITSLALLLSHADFLVPIPKWFPASSMHWCCAPSMVSFRGLYAMWEGLTLLAILLLLLWNKIPHFYLAVLPEGQHSHGDGFGPLIPVWFLNLKILWSLLQTVTSPKNKCCFDLRSVQNMYIW